MPLAPLHSRNGVVRKSSRQEPGDDKDWPPPSFPAAVCCEDKGERGRNEAGVKSNVHFSIWPKRPKPTMN